MKKFLALLLVCVLAFSLIVSLTACKGKNKNPDTDTDDVVDTPGADEDQSNQTGGSSAPLNSDEGVALPAIPVTSTPANSENTEGGENTDGQ